MLPLPAAMPLDRPALTDGEILATSRALGGLAPGAASLWRELSNPDVDAGRLRAVLHQDPGIAARVLKVANSAFYGRGRQIASLEQAVLVLGLDGVRGIAAAASLDRASDQGGRGSALLAHSAAVAACAQSIAARGSLVGPSEAFLAGLLHDFGLLVEWKLAAGAGGPGAGAALHQRCAEVVLSHWQLPSTVVDAARLHHEAASGDALAACVRVAHAAAQAAGRIEPVAGEGYDLDEPDPHDLAQVGFDAAAWVRWCETDRETALEAADALMP